MRRTRTDPIKHAIGTALQPGKFIGYGTSASFVSGLEAVETGIKELISNSTLHQSGEACGDDRGGNHRARDEPEEARQA